MSDLKTWNRILSAGSWDDQISVIEILPGKENTVSSKIDVAFQVFHTDVKKLSSRKMVPLDRDLRRPIYATQFDSTTKYLRWKLKNQSLFLGVFASHLDEAGEQYLVAHNGRCVHTLMCFSAWLAQVQSNYRRPDWCTAKAVEVAKGNWQVVNCNSLSPEDITRLFNEGVANVEAAKLHSDDEIRSSLLKGALDITGNKVNDAQQHSRELYLKEVEPQGAVH